LLESVDEGVKEMKLPRTGYLITEPGPGSELEEEEGDIINLLIRPKIKVQVSLISH